MKDANRNWPVDPERIAKGLYWQKTWKLVEGCTHVSAGCDNCWSAAETRIRAGQANPKISAPKQGLLKGSRFNGKIRLREDNLEKPLHKQAPTVYAVWNDLFHEDVPFDFILKAFDRMEQTPWHTFLVLTKRPQRMEKFCFKYGIGSANRWPLNVIPGTSVENQPTAGERIPHLLKLKSYIPYLKVYVSYEPALGPVIFRPYTLTERPCFVCEVEDECGEQRGTMSHPINCGWRHDLEGAGKPPQQEPAGSGIDWVIMGGESGPGARPLHPDWARSIRDQCKEAGVPFFFKGWGEWIHESQPECPSGLSYDGRNVFNWGYLDHSFRVGKSRAGCLLDGMEWKKCP